jgi:carbamoyl-phosphate synthase large subunit
MNYKTIMINCNPETVSTDYDICDKLYFEQITFERVLDIYDKERPEGVIISMGGQTPNNLAIKLHGAGIKILGTSPDQIDNAENRHKFSQILDKIKIDQPEWKELTSFAKAKEFAHKVGYPVLIRPSYVLSGAAMSIVLNDSELKQLLQKAAAISKDYPVVISKFITDAREIEVDAVADNGSLFCYAISEHVENAGVHSGDATIVLPPQRTYLETMRRVKMITKDIAQALKITGPFNIQFIAKDNVVKVIECNLRASRSFPFVSKVLKINFIDIATKFMLGQKIPKIDKSSFDVDYVGVKAPQFSFTRLKGSDPVLGVEMASTGEVACLGDEFNEAFLKSFISTGYKIPQKGVMLSTGTPKDKAEFLDETRKLYSMGLKFYATRGTADFLKKYGMKAQILNWPLEKREPNILTYLNNGKIDLVINIPKSEEKYELDNDYIVRRKAIDMNINLITNLQVAKRFVKTMDRYNEDNLSVKSWDEYN